MDSKGNFMAESVFKKVFNCAQAVLSSHCEEYGKQERP